MDVRRWERADIHTSDDRQKQAVIHTSDGRREQAGVQTLDGQQKQADMRTLNGCLKNADKRKNLPEISKSNGISLREEQDNPRAIPACPITTQTSVSQNSTQPSTNKDPLQRQTSQSSTPTSASQSSTQTSASQSSTQTSSSKDPLQGQASQSSTQTSASQRATQSLTSQNTIQSSTSNNTLQPSINHNTIQIPEGQTSTPLCEFFKISSYNPESEQNIKEALESCHSENNKITRDETQTSAKALVDLVEQKEIEHYKNSTNTQVCLQQSFNTNKTSKITKDSKKATKCLVDVVVQTELKHHKNPEEIQTCMRQNFGNNQTTQQIMESIKVSKRKSVCRLKKKTKTLSFLIILILQALLPLFLYHFDFALDLKLASQLASFWLDRSVSIRSKITERLENVTDTSLAIKDQPKLPELISSTITNLDYECYGQQWMFNLLMYAVSNFNVSENYLSKTIQHRLIPRCYLSREMLAVETLKVQARKVISELLMDIKPTLIDRTSYQSWYVKAEKMTYIANLLLTNDNLKELAKNSYKKYKRSMFSTDPSTTSLTDMYLSLQTVKELLILKFRPSINPYFFSVSSSNIVSLWTHYLLMGSVELKFMRKIYKTPFEQELHTWYLKIKAAEIKLIEIVEKSKGSLEELLLKHKPIWLTFLSMQIVDSALIEYIKFLSLDYLHSGRHKHSHFSYDDLTPGLSIINKKIWPHFNISNAISMLSQKYNILSKRKLRKDYKSIWTSYFIVNYITRKLNYESAEGEFGFIPFYIKHPVLKLRVGYYIGALDNFLYTVTLAFIILFGFSYTLNISLAVQTFKFNSLNIVCADQEIIFRFTFYMYKCILNFYKHKRLRVCLSCIQAWPAIIFIQKALLLYLSHKLPDNTDLQQHADTLSTKLLAISVSDTLLESSSQLILVCFAALQTTGLISLLHPANIGLVWIIKVIMTPLSISWTLLKEIERHTSQMEIHFLGKISIFLHFYFECSLRLWLLPILIYKFSWAVAIGYVVHILLTFFLYLFDSYRYNNIGQLFSSSGLKRLCLAPFLFVPKKNLKQGWSIGKGIFFFIMLLEDCLIVYSTGLLSEDNLDACNSLLAYLPFLSDTCYPIALPIIICLSVFFNIGHYVFIRPIRKRFKLKCKYSLQCSSITETPSPKPEGVCSYKEKPNKRETVSGTDTSRCSAEPRAYDNQAFDIQEHL